MKKCLIIAITILVYSSLYPQVINTNLGKIEFIGLKSMSPKTLVDSIAKLIPGRPIHGCAGAMEHDFGFSEVSSILYPMGKGKFYDVVTIIENDSAKRIKYLDTPKDTLATLRSFKSLESIINNRKTYFPALIMYYKIQKDGYPDSAKAIADQFGLNTESLRIFCRFLNEHQSVKDLNLALWLLNNDSNLINDKAALAILVNFKNYDVVWWTLMNLQRSKNIQISMNSLEILRLLIEKPKDVNWGPAVSAIRSILAGTNLFAYWNTLEVLVKTNISSNLTNQLLNGNKDLLIEYLNAQQKQTREPAIQFVKHMSNGKATDDPLKCKEWLSNF